MSKNLFWSENFHPKNEKFRAESHIWINNGEVKILSTHAQSPMWFSAVCSNFVGNLQCLSKNCNFLLRLHVFFNPWRSGGGIPPHPKHVPTLLVKYYCQNNNNNIYLGKSNQAARKGTGLSKLTTHKSNEKKAIHAQKNIQNRNMLSIST